MEAVRWDDQLGLSTNGNYYEDWGGWQEKWILGENSVWYFITPAGDLYQWHGGAIGNSTLLGHVGTDYHADPALLHEAHDLFERLLPVSETWAVDAAIVQLDEELGLLTSSNYYLNWGGWNEKWILGANSVWYFITSNGDFYQWHGGSISNSTLLTTLDSIFYDTPTLLTEAFV